jgi:hypothetical protein
MVVQIQNFLFENHLQDTLILLQKEQIKIIQAQQKIEILF